MLKMNKDQEPKRLNPFENAIQHWLDFTNPNETEDLLASLAGIDDPEFHPIKKVDENSSKNVYNSQDMTDDEI